MAPEQNTTGGSREDFVELKTTKFRDSVSSSDACQCMSTALAVPALHEVLLVHRDQLGLLVEMVTGAWFARMSISTIMSTFQEGRVGVTGPIGPPGPPGLPGPPGEDSNCESCDWSDIAKELPTHYQGPQQCQQQAPIRTTIAPGM